MSKLLPKNNKRFLIKLKVAFVSWWMLKADHICTIPAMVFASSPKKSGQATWQFKE